MFWRPGLKRSALIIFFAWMSSPGESNQLISPKIFERFALPYHVAYHEQLKEMGIGWFGFHICGEQNANLPVLAEALPWSHPSVLSFGHEVAICDAGRFFPRDIIFGNIDPAIIQTGNPNQIYELSRRAIEDGKKLESGFILGPGVRHACPRAAYQCMGNDSGRE